MSTPAISGKSKHHAILGGSVAEKWLNCAGYEQAVTGCPPSPPNDATVKGDSEHHLIETVITAAMPVHAYRGKPWIDVPEEWAHKRYDDDQIEACTVWLHWLDETLDVCAGDKLYIEKPVVLSSISNELSGTGDGIIVSPARKLLIIADYKGGAGKDVDPVELPQGKFYAVGAADTLLPDLGEGWTVMIAIIQPRSGGVKTWTALPGSIGEWRGEFRAAFKRQKQPHAPRTAGGHCHWCLRSGDCPTLAESRRLSIRKDFAASATPEGTHPVASLTPEQIGNVLRAAPRVREWLDAVEDAARARLMTGGGIPGFKLVEGRKGARAWKDEAAAGERLEVLLGDKAYEHKLLSPAKAEKLLKDGMSGLADMIEQPAGKPTIAPVESSKSEYSKIAQAIADFSV